MRSRRISAFWVVLLAATVGMAADASTFDPPEPVEGRSMAGELWVEIVEGRVVVAVDALREGRADGWVDQVIRFKPSKEQGRETWSGIQYGGFGLIEVAEDQVTLTYPQRRESWRLVFLPRHVGETPSAAEVTPNTIRLYGRELAFWFPGDRLEILPTEALDRERSLLQEPEVRALSGAIFQQSPEPSDEEEGCRVQCSAVCTDRTSCEADCGEAGKCAECDCEPSASCQCREFQPGG